MMPVTCPVGMTPTWASPSTIVALINIGAFAASGSVVKDTVRTIWRADIQQSGTEIVLYVEGNGFLYNMVRIIAGTLIGVGSGKIERGAFRRAIESGSRLDLGVTAPAHGLTLMEVFYQDRCVQEDAQ